MLAVYERFSHCSCLPEVKCIPVCPLLNECSCGCILESYTVNVVFFAGWKFLQKCWLGLSCRGIFFLYLSHLLSLMGFIFTWGGIFGKRAIS